MANIKVIWDGGKQSKELGVGDKTSPKDFPNDAIQEIHVPFGMSVGAFKDGKFSGEQRLLRGDNLAGVSVYKLKDLQFDKVISNMRISSLTKGIL